MCDGSKSFSNILKAKATAEAKAKATAETRETQTKETTHGLKTNKTTYSQTLSVGLLFKALMAAMAIKQIEKAKNNKRQKKKKSTIDVPPKT